MHNDVTRRTFLAALSASAAGVLTGGLSKLVAAASASTSKTGGTFLLGGDLLVNRLGFGAMRLTGEGIRKKQARLIIGSDSGGNRTDKKGRADCQLPEPISYDR